MAFQFTKDKSNALMLTLSGNIDLEVTPEIKAQLSTRITDVAHLKIDAANVNYIDSSGVSVLIIAMQSCKKKSISFEIIAASDELMRVIRLAKLEKLLPITRQTGPAHMVDSQAAASDQTSIETGMPDFGDGGASDDDLIADLSGGNLGVTSAQPDPATADRTQPKAPSKPDEPAPDASSAEPTSPSSSSGSGGIKPGTFG